MRARVLLVFLLLGANGAAQKPTSEPARVEPLVRVTVDLVQLDVIVTDHDGKHVFDLKPDDFEILENGKPQHITNFSFIPSETLAPPAVPANPLHSLIAPVPVTPAQVRRTMAVVVDDLGIGEHSFASVHRALEQFVDSQVQPGDLVAIITTSGRLGALQQLTADRRLLRAAIAKFRSLPNHRPGVEDDDFTCVWFNHKWEARPGAEVQDEDAWLSLQAASCGLDCPPELDPQRELIKDQRSEYYGRLSIAALRRVVDGLHELPGRKSILLFSEGVPLLRGQGLGDVNEALKQAYEAFLTHANRSGVTVDTLDPRGLLVLSATAERARDACADARKTELVNTQRELAEISRRTGGISISDNNDLPGAIARVTSDQLGYYLIAYKPSAHPAKPPPGSPAVRKIAIRVHRPGLIARFHSSLYDESGDRSSPDEGRDRLATAAASPFAIPNIHVRISTRFWDAGPAAGSILDTTLQIEARDLNFRTEDDGRRKAVFDVLAFVYGAEAKPLNALEKSYTISLSPDAYERALADGLVQRLELAVKRPGAYQIRGAVRDRYEDRVGSASDFVEVPDLTQGRLALSGIVLSGSPGGASLVRYHPGQRVFYACQVLNPRRAADGSIRVGVQATLFRDQRPLGSSRFILLDGKDQPDLKRLLVADDFRLGQQLPSGDYTLQVVAVDQNAAPKVTASQSIDFEATNLQ